MKKYENFRKALNNLNDIYGVEEPYSNITRSGCVNLFEICFELSWKVMKEVLENHGYDEGKTGSPKMVLKTAYSAGLIDDETIWIKALQARNNVAHSYNENIADSIISETKSDYVSMFEKLDKVLLEKWI